MFNSQNYINIPREISVISLLKSYFDLNFEVIKRTVNSRYANGKDMRLVNLGPIALFSIFILKTSSGKNLEDITLAHILSLMYKLLTSSRGSDDLSIRFNRDRNRRPEELTSNKNIKGNYLLRVMLKDVFGFAEHQEKATYGLGYKLTLTRTKDDAVLDKVEGLPAARIKIDHLHWYIPQYTPSLQQQTILSKIILSKTPTELK